MSADTTSRYRADIQGLRAVAVLTVIGAHVGIVPLAGGFVGVDVFFVISGFLISRLLFLEASRRGSISLTGFYARRARRILPAATLVTVVTLAAAQLWMSVMDAVQVVSDAAWAALFLANVRVARRGVDYFAQGEAPSPLQHYWSLSVEEQFYLVWPALLVGCLAWSRHRGGPGRLPRLPLLVALGALTLASFGYASVLTHTAPVTAYFSTPARVWELGVGAITALVAPTLAGRTGLRLRGLLAATGLGLIAVACLEFGTETPFPGSAALLPVLGTALALVGGADAAGRQPLATRALGTRPLAVVGDWSYSLYLWHWPVLVLARIRLGRELTAVESVVAVALVVALSAATYRFVETPFRRGTRLSVPRSLVLYPVTLAVVATACVGGLRYAQWRGGERGDDPAITLADYAGTVAVGGTRGRSLADPDRTVALVQASVIAGRERRPVPSDLTPDLLDLRDDVADVGACEYALDVRSLCRRGAARAGRTLVVLGDSHGRHWIPAVERLATRGSWSTYYLVKPQCPANGLVVGRYPTGEPWDDCTRFATWARDRIDRLDPDLLLLSSAPPVRGVYLGGRHLVEEDDVAAALTQGYRRLFRRLRPLTERLVLIRDVPHAPEEPGVCLGTGRPDLGDCLFRPEPEAERMAQVSVDAARRAGVEVVDPRSWLCWQDRCPAVVGSVISYRDRGHLSTAYAARLAEPLGRALGLWLE